MSFVAHDGDPFTAHIAEMLGRLLVDAGIPKARAARLVAASLDELRGHFGGRNLYLRRGRTPKAQRAMDVFARHAAGEPVSEIAKRLDLTAAYVAQLLAIERRRLAGIRRKQQAPSTPAKRPTSASTLTRHPPSQHRSTRHHG